MGEHKTIISANIPVSLVDSLKNKTKGTRSRVIERALRAYLNDKDAFNISDYETQTLMVVLMNRDDCPSPIKALLMDEMGWKK